jgi:hypothetical protein
VCITIVWIRQEFAIAMYWTTKQQGASHKRELPGK